MKLKTVNFAHNEHGKASTIKLMTNYHKTGHGQGSMHLLITLEPSIFLEKVKLGILNLVHRKNCYKRGHDHGHGHVA